MVGLQTVRVRKGWWRNQRSVSVDEAGLVVERWLGRPQVIPWADLQAARWLRADRVLLTTASRRLVLTASSGELESLLSTIASAAARGRQHRPTPADIGRWLGRRRRFRARPLVDSGGWDTLGCVGVPEVALGCMLPILGAAQGAVAICHACHWSVWLSLPLAVALVPPLVFFGVTLVHVLNLEVSDLHRMEADLDRCRIRIGRSVDASFAWSEVNSVCATGARITVGLANGDQVTYAPSGRLDAVTRALTAAAALRQPFVIEAADRGLSPAERPSAGADRGLSRL